jgi:UPF0755 protein
VANERGANSWAGINIEGDGVNGIGFEGNGSEGDPDARRVAAGLSRDGRTGVGGARTDGDPGPGEHTDSRGDPGEYGDGGYADGAGYLDDGYADDGYDDDGYADDGYDDDGYGDEGDAGDDGYAGDGNWQAGKEHPGPSRRRRHPVLAAFLVLVAAVILLAGAGILWAARQVYPGGHPGNKVLVTIPGGADTARIGAVLAKAGVIHEGNLFRYYMKVEGGAPLLAGTYLLAKNESYDQVIATLQAGPVVIADKLVIPEGFTLRQIAYRVAHLPGMHVSAAAFLALSSSGSVRSPLEPSGVNNLEGLVYPATYSINRTDSATTILEEMVGAFDQEVNSLGIDAAAARLHTTPYKVITVASIIQGEAKFSAQFPEVASVIYNRLAAGTALGTDSTLVYALRQADPNLNISKVNFEQPSPYNTRLHKGLPPTPIDNPSQAAMAAAIAPAHTSYQYFVEVNPNGTLGFASTSAGFAQLRTECNNNHLDC